MDTFLAVDWGTTNRRIYRIERGAVAHTARDDRGVRAMVGSDYEAEAALIRADHGELPMLLAGMVGSAIGWREVPYVAAPADLAAVAAGLLAIDERTAIVPGLSIRDGSHADVMRGEEVQLLGAAAAGLVPDGALLCQPGTHCKWARIEHGEVAHFVTAMTGELFALLKAHSLLAPQLAHPVIDGPAFVAGVERGARGDLPAALFGIRAASLLGVRDDAEAASHASGILIGADVAAQVRRGAHVHVLADPDLARLYRTAIETLGGSAEPIDSHAAFVAGIVAIRELSL